MPLASPAPRPARPARPHVTTDIGEYVVHRVEEDCLRDGALEANTFLWDEHAQMTWAHALVDRVLGVHMSTLAKLDTASEPSNAVRSLLDAIRPRLLASPAPQLLRLYALVRAVGEYDMNAYRWLLYRDGVCVLSSWIHRLVHNVWAGFYASQAGALLAPDAYKHFGPALPLPGAATCVLGARSEAVAEHACLESLEIHALELLYHVLCAVRLRPSDMRGLTVDFVNHLLDTMERAQQDHEEEYCVRRMRVILALHEQCLVQDPSAVLLPVIRRGLLASKTFGETLVFRLNRTVSTTFSGALFHFLALKLLSDLFSQRETASFFYTNDLRVLVDIFVRELGGLPDTCELLRQAYLYVFRALLTQTQLCSEPYKRGDVQYLLMHIVSSAQWHDTSRVTLALANDCLDSEWFVGVQDGATLVRPIHGGAPRVAPLTKEHAEGHVHYHALPTLQTIQHTLALQRIQSAAAALACVAGTYADTAETVVWPPCAPVAEADGALGEIDVDTLELWASEGPRARRRVPPPRPVKPPRAAAGPPRRRAPPPPPR
ncbi:pre-rRNA processing [Malassezia nana]|uniref:Pre-rRNA processing n=1 Tax=Malassezia nana TaxID=180528 RepID=A0AAF0J4A3_9BASI|nr:pre-rRNA processing [Malassezia nana]